MIRRFHLRSSTIEVKRSVTNAAHGNARKRWNRLQVSLVITDCSVNSYTVSWASVPLPLTKICTHDTVLFLPSTGTDESRRFPTFGRYLWRPSSYPSCWWQKPTSRARGPNINVILHYNRYIRHKIYAWKTRP